MTSKVRKEVNRMNLKTLATALGIFLVLKKIADSNKACLYAGPIKICNK